MCRAMPFGLAVFLSRNGATDSEDMAFTGFKLVLAHLRGVYGGTTSEAWQEQHCIYHMWTAEDYIGRTALYHRSSPSVGGLALRWEQHMRQLMLCSNAKIKNKRTRYKILLRGTSNRFILSFVRDFASPDREQNMESYHIVLCEPTANNLLMTPGYRTPRAPTHFVAGKPSRKRRPLSMTERLARLDSSSMLPREDALMQNRWNRIAARVDGDFKQHGLTNLKKQTPITPNGNWYFQERDASLAAAEGPLDMYTLGHWKLLRIAAECPLDFSWFQALLYRKQKLDWLVVMFSSCDLIPKPLDRTRACTGRKSWRPTVGKEVLHCRGE